MGFHSWIPAPLGGALVFTKPCGCPVALVRSTVVIWMAMEDREVMEARGAGESCPTLSKVAPVDSMPEGKPKASLDAEVPKLELPTLEENGICEDRDCPGPPRSLPPKSGPNAKGQAGDGPGLESVELPLPLETEHRNAMELEKVRMEFELTLLKYLHQENERQRQHEEVMEQLQQQQQQQQALPHQISLQVISGSTHQCRTDTFSPAHSSAACPRNLS